jgi:hypothetical protein
LDTPPPRGEGIQKIAERQCLYFGGKGFLGYPPLRGEGIQKIVELQNIYILEERGFLDAPPFGGEGIQKIEISLFLSLVIKNIPKQFNKVFANKVNTKQKQNVICC